jgi:hypothetical protein
MVSLSLFDKWPIAGEESHPGTIIAIQTFGDCLTPELHYSVTPGCLQQKAFDFST